MSRRAGLKAVWKRGQHGWPARFPVAQVPNAPLLLASAGWLTAELTHGSAHSYSRAVFLSGLGAWAWGELADGSNWFRRAMGAGGFAYVVATVGGAIGAGG